MNKIVKSLIISFFSTSVISACADKTPLIVNEPLQQSNQIKKLSTEDIPIFNKRKLGNAALLPVNSINEQKKKQMKLHTFYFKSYSNGSSYSTSDTNAHMKMLNEGSTAAGIKLDSNNDGSVTMDEISKLVTNDAYIKFFRQKYIVFSYNKLDKSSDNKLSVDEFNQFNSVVKAKEVADFQLLEEFSDYDYNSSRGLDLEEYEDFFMEYLLIKYGV
jgi:hypothetical protein